MRRGSIHRKERWVLLSKQNTVYKLIRLLELVPDGGEIAWERDTCQWWRSQGWDTKPRLELRSGKKLIRSGRRQRHGTGGGWGRWRQQKARDEARGPEVGKAQSPPGVKATGTPLALSFTCCLWPPGTDVDNNSASEPEAVLCSGISQLN